MSKSTISEYAYVQQKRGIPWILIVVVLAIAAVAVVVALLLKKKQKQQGLPLVNPNMSSPEDGNAINAMGIDL